ncbi:RNA polymerase sigma factor [Myxococcota bacterium]|nr:RNA polymerase sigma factor [Myxococcota bacterium]MBU1536964.1 RNA polymerase sigma factor [Myxococcota bacterium]
MEAVSTEQFAQFIGKTKKMVLKAVLVHLHPELTNFIDDVVQETYLRAWKALVKDQFRGDSEVSTWLYVIAKNEARRTNKKMGVKAVDPALLYPQNEPEEFPLEVLEEFIGQLPEKYGSIFSLRLKGFTEEEIASRLQISKGTVKSRASRGKKLLARLLTEARS